MMTLFFTESPVPDYGSAVSYGTKPYGKYFHEMLKRRLYLPPAQSEAIFASSAYTKEDLDKTIAANHDALETIL